jgi:signal transduction histidine kinase
VQVNSVSKNNKLALGQRLLHSLSTGHRAWGRHSHSGVTLFLFLMFCGMACVGIFVMRDLRTANAISQKTTATSLQGLNSIAELEHEARETRQLTLYALTTDDSNLQVEYADRTREADRKVTEGIREFVQGAKTPEEIEVFKKLRHDWSEYINVRNEVLASSLEGSIKEALRHDLEEGVPSFDRMDRDLGEVKQLYSQYAALSVAHAAALSSRIRTGLVVFLGLAVAFAITSVLAIQEGKILNAMHLTKLRMEFVAAVSHELRSPLAVISSAADNLVDGIVDGKEGLRRYGLVIRKQNRQMTELVDQILLFSSSKDRRSKYDLRLLQVSQIIETVVESTAELAQEKGFRVEQHIEAGLPSVRGELSALCQCLRNLVVNAIKYSGDCRWIGISARLEDRTTSTGKEVWITVTDHGIGIDGAELPHIFDPFYRSPKVSAVQIHGTGLGLSLARRIAEAMHGRLSVVSEPAEGSAFTLHLPVSEREMSESTAVASLAGPLIPE